MNSKLILRIIKVVFNQSIGTVSMIIMTIFMWRLNVNVAMKCIFPRVERSLASADAYIVYLFRWM